MSYFSQHATVEKKVVVTYFGNKYVTPSGLAGSLGTDVALRILEEMRNNTKKYGRPTYSDPKALELWKSHKNRLRKKFIRRALPLIERLFL
jgi:hypothetical protein